ncbi:transcriptional antiterminator [Streptococcus criceti]|uniref:Transcriptional antiterminator, BglG family n=1 Tax=Streptococcus criceti HS-6 TaxID=873449 RepID=G5JSX6_STRCG|nr:transcription antiterminator [Streptococcus criceti]EHI75038.1 transcriptional antiterminator, BglG family [Streptococcus criceti HS-6]SUN43495.1 transcriptional antiterminator [Streptococcus criceti]
MIFLDKRSYALLNYLLKLKEPETIMAISKALGQSRRKIYYHLDKINEALPDTVGKIISYPRIGIVLTEEQKKVCQDLMAELDDYTYVMKVDERLQLMLIYIGVAAEKVTLEKLMQLTDVSRNTVLNDLQEMRQQLNRGIFGITLQVNKARGYYLDCPALVKIQFFYKLLQSIVYEGNEGFNEIVHLKIREFSPDNLYFSENMRSYFTEQVNQLTDRLGKKINCYDRQFMARALPYLLSVYRNMSLSNEERVTVHREFSMARERKEYRLVQDLADGVYQTYGIRLDELEKSIVAMLILSFRKDRDEHVESHDYDDMRQQLDHFLKKYETLYHGSFVHRDLLLSQLVAHCKSMLYRKTYGISSINPLTNQIKENYQTLFEQTKSCADILERAWFISLTDDDIAYLAVHLGGELEKEEKDNNHFNQVEVTLVCDDGVGVQKFFLQQCRRILPNTRIEAVFSSEQFHSISDLLTSDFVITTSDPDTLTSALPVLQVNAVLTDEDIVRMVRFIRRESADHQAFDEEIEHYIRQYVKSDKEAYILLKKIEKVFYQELLKDVSGYY